MSPRPKTIQIFLPGGDPQGIRVAEITTRIVQVIEVPRSLLGDFLKMDESTQVALYLSLIHISSPRDRTRSRMPSSALKKNMQCSRIQLRQELARLLNIQSPESL